MTVRHSPFDPPPEMHSVADMLSEAVDALLAGDEGRAGDILQGANIPSLWAYADRAMNPPKGMRAVRPGNSAMPVIAKADRAISRMPSAGQERSVFRRDGYRCRYCGSRVVLKQARSILTSQLPMHVPWPLGPKGDKGKHAAFYALNSVVDHVVPYSRGGDSSPENLVTACWPCNFFKEDATLEELGWTDPRSRPPVIDGWDGLERILRVGRSFKVKELMQDSDTKGIIERPTKSNRTRTTPDNSLDEWVKSFVGRPNNISSRLADLLHALEGPNVFLSIDSFLIVTLSANQNQLAVFGISPNGDVDVPWLIGNWKGLFKSFAADLAQAIPGAKLYETKTMWRVDGAGMAKGQISVEELVATGNVVKEAVAELVRELDRITA